MGAYWAKQPNGKYCRFSSVVDGVTHYNKTASQVIGYYVRKAKEEALYDLEHRVKDFDCVIEDTADYQKDDKGWKKMLMRVGYLAETEKTKTPTCGNCTHIGQDEFGTFCCKLGITIIMEQCEKHEFKPTKQK